QRVTCPIVIVSYDVRSPFGQGRAHLLEKPRLRIERAYQVIMYAKLNAKKILGKEERIAQIFDVFRFPKRASVPFEDSKRTTLILKWTNQQSGFVSVKPISQPQYPRELFADPAPRAEDLFAVDRRADRPTG